MLANYNPWGKPGHGAPMPGALRKTKWIFEDVKEETNGRSVTTLGRPGHGAPLKTPTGKIQANIKSDPLIRFQMHNLTRGAVENELRYRFTPKDKENYRRELDAIICQKKKKKTDKDPASPDVEEPKGWTSHSTIQAFDKNKSEREQVYEIGGGGVELVPLLAKHRMVTRYPLSTTDITRMSRICNDFPKVDLTTSEYIQHLCTQMNEKEKQKLKEQKKDALESRKHFETWKGFWGRPGHGAPKALSQREKLEVLLYRVPPRATKSGVEKKQ